MARLVDVFRVDKPQPLDRGQLPLSIDDNLTMVMDVSGLELICDTHIVTGEEFSEFVRKITVLTPQEVRDTFQLPCKDLTGVISQAVPCVGCRRSVERLLTQLTETAHLALYPLEFSADGKFCIRAERLRSPRGLSSILHGPSTKLNTLVGNQPRSKKSRRCNLHSLDSHRQPRPLTTIWKDLWNSMRPQCKEEVVMIESTKLLVTLESFLRNNRFCGECRIKVLKAYTLLMEEPDPTKEKGYIPSLYVGIRRCLSEKHIHLPTKIEYIGNLITRANPDLLSSGRERHAKTMAIAQEEVLCCLGLLLYDRLCRIYMRMREEECACQVLAAVAIEALCKNFERTVENKKGVSQYDLLVEEIKQEEVAKERKEHKNRKKKRKKKSEKKPDVGTKCEREDDEKLDVSGDESSNTCTCSESKPTTQSTDRHKLQVLDRKGKGSPTCYCKDCLQKKKAKGNIEDGKANSMNVLDAEVIDEAVPKVENADRGISSASEIWYNNEYTHRRSDNENNFSDPQTLKCSPKAEEGNSLHRTETQLSSEAIPETTGVCSSNFTKPCVTTESDIAEVSNMKGSLEKNIHLVVSQNKDYSESNKTEAQRMSDDEKENLYLDIAISLNGSTSRSNVETSALEKSLEKQLSLSPHKSKENVPVLLVDDCGSRNDCCSKEPCSHDGGYPSEHICICSDKVSSIGSEKLLSDELYDKEHDDQSSHIDDKILQNIPVQKVFIRKRKIELPSLTLKQMLERECSSDEDGEESFIPVEVVQEFKARIHQVTEKRLELRQTLRKRFDQLCGIGCAAQPMVPLPTHCAFN